MLTPRAFARSTVFFMVSASPAWKPQAMLTEVASSIIAASLPIGQTPKLSPRSQLRSIAMVSCSVVEMGVLWFRKRPSLPRPAVECIDGGARDIGALQCIAEVGAACFTHTVWQRPQQAGHGARLGLRLRHGDRLEAETDARRNLREAAKVSRDHGRDLRVTAAGAAIRHQHDRLSVARDLNAAVHSAVGHDVVPMQVLDDRTFKAIAHAVAGRRNLPLAAE